MGNQYIPFTEAEKHQARETDIVELLLSRGEAVRRSGTEYLWRNGSEKVIIRGNLWYHPYELKGGDAISFVQQFFHQSYPQAVCLLLGIEGDVRCEELQRGARTEFVLPPHNERMSRVYAYLLQYRGIERAVLDAFVHKQMIYESAPYHNVVFVGFDKEGNPCHANLRGTGRESTFKGNAPGSIPEYSFHWNGASAEVYFFEAPIDLLSYISMHQDRWQEHNYAAACSVSDRVLLQMLRDHPHLRMVHICFDNDTAGQKVASRIRDKLFTEGINTEILVPIAKDWNEDLLHLRRETTTCKDSPR